MNVPIMFYHINMTKTNFNFYFNLSILVFVWLKYLFYGSYSIWISL